MRILSSTILLLLTPNTLNLPFISAFHFANSTGLIWDLYPNAERMQHIFLNCDSSWLVVNLALCQARNVNPLHCSLFIFFLTFHPSIRFPFKNRSIISESYSMKKLIQIMTVKWSLMIALHCQREELAKKPLITLL